MGGDVRSANREQPELDGAGLRVALVCGRFNDHITDRLLDGALNCLVARGVADSDIHVTWVPGAFEIPLMARTWATSGRVDAVIGLGAVIRGETSHYDLVAGQCAEGLQQVGLATGVPTVFGVLTTENLDQALARSEGPGGHNVGATGAATAIEMVRTITAIRER